eukprot:PhF_6_TR26066/c0_g1_i2/m.36758
MDAESKIPWRDQLLRLKNKSSRRSNSVCSDCSAPVNTVARKALQIIEESDNDIIQMIQTDQKLLEEMKRLETENSVLRRSNAELSRLNQTLQMYLPTSTPGGGGGNKSRDSSQNLHPPNTCVPMEDFEAVQRQAQDMSHKMAELRSENHDYILERNSLESKCANLVTVINQLEDSVNRLNGYNSRLERKCSDKGTEIALAESNIQKMQTEFEALQALCRQWEDKYESQRLECDEMRRALLEERAAFDRYVSESAAAGRMCASQEPNNTNNTDGGGATPHDPSGHHSSAPGSATPCGRIPNNSSFILNATVLSDNQNMSSYPLPPGGVDMGDDGGMLAGSTGGCSPLLVSPSQQDPFLFSVNRSGLCTIPQQTIRMLRQSFLNIHNDWAALRRNVSRTVEDYSAEVSHLKRDSLAGVAKYREQQHNAFRMLADEVAKIKASHSLLRQLVSVTLTQYTNNLDASVITPLIKRIHDLESEKDRVLLELVRTKLRLAQDNYKLEELSLKKAPAGKGTSSSSSKPSHEDPVPPPPPPSVSKKPLSVHQKSEIASQINTMQDKYNTPPRPDKPSK